MIDNYCPCGLVHITESKDSVQYYYKRAQFIDVLFPKNLSKIIVSKKKGTFIINITMDSI